MKAPTHRGLLAGAFLLVTLALVAAGSTASVALAWDCQPGYKDNYQNQKSGKCVEHREPTPTHVSYPTKTPVPPPTATPQAPSTEVPPTSVPPTQVAPPTPGPTAPPTPAAPLAGPPSGGPSFTDLCVYTFENGLVRVDLKRVADGNRWVASHTGRADLPDDFVPALGQMCGITLFDLQPTPVPTVASEPVAEFAPVAAPPVPEPLIIAITEPVYPMVCFRTDEEGNVTNNDAGKPVVVPCDSTPSVAAPPDYVPDEASPPEQPESPPATGDGTGTDELVP